VNCRGVERWLDQGMPADDRENAMRHAAICGACSEAIEAASGLEAALRGAAATAWAAPTASADSADSADSTTSPAPPSPDFVANVMTRIAAADSLAREARLERRPARLWISLATDPISVSAITAALLVAVWTFRHPNWMLEAGMNLVGWWWSAAALAPQGRVDVDPIVWIELAIAVFPLALWGSWLLYRRIERALLLLAARPGV
jgi:hypothetical protein